MLQSLGPGGSPALLLPPPSGQGQARPSGSHGLPKAEQWKGRETGKRQKEDKRKGGWHSVAGGSPQSTQTPQPRPRHSHRHHHHLPSWPDIRYRKLCARVHRRRQSGLRGGFLSPQTLWRRPLRGCGTSGQRRLLRARRGTEGFWLGLAWPSFCGLVFTWVSPGCSHPQPGQELWLSWCGACGLRTARPSLRPTPAQPWGTGLSPTEGAASQPWLRPQQHQSSEKGPRRWLHLWCQGEGVWKWEGSSVSCPRATGSGPRAGTVLALYTTLAE